MKALYYAAWALALGATLVTAQTITGSIVGSVKDASGLPVMGAEIKVVQKSTGLARQAQSSDRGDFAFPGMPPGDYSLTIKAPGFKTVEQTSLNLSASETLPVGAITLEVGNVAETVTVTAQGVVVQTASSERSGVITGGQVENIQIRGRNVMSLLNLLPGVVAPAEPDSVNRAWGGFVNGNRTDSNSLSIDGMGQNQIGAGRNLLLTVSQDSVSEVKILLSNYQAEYGRFSGANVQVITKSGTRDFHGLFSYFKRHEQFNANTFFNNRLGIEKPRYRYNTWNYNIGGPIYIPGKFNRNRDKLFFFWSQEFWPVKTTNSGRQATMPTALERAGDFSQSVDQNGVRIPVVDPVTRQPFPGNVVPASRLDPSGQALLKVFPTPNFFDRGISAGRYNYVFNSESSIPQKLETLKVDYNLSSKHMFFLSYLFQTDDQSGYSVPAGGGQTWNQFLLHYWTYPKQGVLRYQYLHSPTLVNELYAGVNGRREGLDYSQSELEKNQRDKLGFTVGQFRPQINPFNVMPNVVLGGIPGAVGLSYDNRFPLVSARVLIVLTDTLTKTWGKHIFKAGINAEKENSTGQSANDFNGRFDFSRNVNNPLDAGHPYANALLGVFNTYNESTTVPGRTIWDTNIEWFFQDNWKVSRRLTLDLGVRFYSLGPHYQTDDKVSTFAPSRFDRSKMVQLVRPATVNGQRVGLNPATGEVLPAAAIGAIAPGSGSESNGMVVPAFDNTYPRGLFEDPGVHAAPRIGFAWDPLGKGKTAVRGGFGMFYNRNDATAGPNVQPPLLSNPTIFYGTFQNFRSSTGLSFPQAVTGIDRTPKQPSSMNMSLSVQQNIGWGTVLDVGYVSTLGRNMLWSRNLNPVPLGANFDPRNADPTNPRVPLPASFLRPILGYADIDFGEFASTSNYHSLQVQGNRRFGKGIDFGASWTWSKTMDFADDDAVAVAVLVPLRQWNYGLASFDRTHVFRINYVWALPEKAWPVRPARWVLNGWQLSGITSFVSGAPLAIGYSFVNATDITGTASQGARVVLTGNPVLPKGDRTFSRNFNTEVVKAPAVGTLGNAGRYNLRGPGINNWDISLLKNIPVGERVKLQFRSEFYNAFNHTQFNGLDVAARFDAQGRQVNARFGEFTGALTPRIIQLAIRASF
jgi:hypothetical protein